MNLALRSRNFVRRQRSAKFIRRNGRDAHGILEYASARIGVSAIDHTIDTPGRGVSRCIGLTLTRGQREACGYRVGGRDGVRDGVRETDVLNLGPILAGVADRDSVS